MDANEFARKMREIAEIGDKEYSHGAADKLMCELLTELGYGEGVELFRSMDKWYA